ncbi:MAG: hydroxymethylglutaryl-CoA lyase [Bacteroidota bacterium]|nr:hydroxymethylglutaryl-CoA lyase [Bacteroidota bacterium]
MLKIVECPRDAMQGIKQFIPTVEKTAYLNLLLKANFDTLDFGSFVSPKAIPQMQDTAEVLKNLDFTGSNTKLLSIIANTRGAAQAVMYDEINYLGFPFSISETFQKRNTNKTIAEAFEEVKHIQGLCNNKNKELVIYISMGFGNPYSDPWSKEIVEQWINVLYNEGIRIFSLSDTAGSAKREDIFPLFKYLTLKYPDCEWGAHFHSIADEAHVKINEAYNGGCRRFDGTLMGFGGCPMAQDELVGNIDTQALLSFAKSANEETKIDFNVLEDAVKLASKLFAKYH